jgi:hypothetical protein
MAEYVAGCHAVGPVPGRAFGLDRFDDGGYTQVVLPPAR